MSSTRSRGKRSVSFQFRMTLDELAKPVVIRPSHKTGRFDIIRGQFKFHVSLEKISKEIELLCYDVSPKFKKKTNWNCRAQSFFVSGTPKHIEQHQVPARLSNWFVLFDFWEVEVSFFGDLLQKQRALNIYKTSHELEDVRKDLPTKPVKSLW